MKVGDIVRHIHATEGRGCFGIITAVFPEATYPASLVRWFEWEIDHFLDNIQRNYCLEVISGSH